MGWDTKRLRRLAGAATIAICLAAVTTHLARAMRKHGTITDQLTEARRELQALATRDPHPSVDNIHAAQSENTRAHAFGAEVQRHFQSAPVPEQLGNLEFRTHLDSTIAQLRSDATRAGVLIPPSYWFTFAAQKGSIAFAAQSLPSLAIQLSDIRTLCEVLFDAKVNGLAWMKRAPVESHDPLGSQDYLNAKPVTNRWVTLMPYELAFQGFSSDLARVLERLAALPQAFVVTNVVVEPASAPGTDTPASGAAALSPDRLPLAVGDSQPPVTDRYRRIPPPFYVTQVRPVLKGTTTMLEEKPLRFTLSIEAVRLRAPAADLASNSGRQRP